MYPLFLLNLVYSKGFNFTNGIQSIRLLHPQFLEAQQARRISVMGICNGITGAIAPIILSAVILPGRKTDKNWPGSMQLWQNESPYPHEQINITLPRRYVSYTGNTGIAYSFHLTGGRCQENKLLVGSTQKRQVFSFFSHLFARHGLIFFLYVGWKSSLVIPSRVMRR